MDKKTARETIRRMLNKMGQNAISISNKHPMKRAKERKFTVQDALRIIDAGTMHDDPKKHRLGFECVLSGVLDDGRKLDIPVIVDLESNTIRVKTFKRVG